MRNLIKIRKRKTLLVYPIFIVGLLFFSTIVYLISDNNTALDTAKIVIIMFFGTMLSLSASLFYISMILRPEYDRKNQISHERFNQYYNSCLNHIKNNNIEKALYIYNNGLRYYNTTNSPEYHKQVMIRGILKYLRNDW